MDIPERERTAKGMPIVNLLPLQAGETIQAIIDTRDFAGERYLFFATRQGAVKKTAFNEYDNGRRDGLIALNLRDGDELVKVIETGGSDDIFMVSRKGMTIRFNEAEVRAMGRAAAGVRGMKLKAGDEFVSVDVARDDTAILPQQWLDTEITPSLATGTYVAPRAGRVTVAEMYKSWSAAQGHISAKTAATRRSAWGSRVEPHWGHVAVIDVKTSAVRAWVAAMATEGVGVPTIENSFGLLRQVLGAAVEDTRIPRNPCDTVKLPKRTHADRGYLSHAQVATLADAHDRDPEVVRFLAYTGLRWGEMAALRVQDFDMLRRRLNVSRSVTESGGLVWSTPKTHERRSVPFPAALADELAALMVGKGRDELVFTDQRGGVLRNSNWRARVFEPAVTAVQSQATAQRAKEIAATGKAATPEFPTITPHDLRHTAASLAVSAGCQCESGATDARTRQGQHDVGRICRPVRRGSRPKLRLFSGVI